MARTRTQIVLELKKARAKLNKADDETQVILARRDIDALLDERLEQKEVHPAACSCHECNQVVADLLTARRFGELEDPRDVAGESGW